MDKKGNENMAALSTTEQSPVSFLETICIMNGIPRHLAWHQRRMEETVSHFYPSVNPLNLKKEISTRDFSKDGKIKCRVIYGREISEISFSPYSPKNTATLRCIEIPSGYSYSYKFADRRVIDELFANRKNADDILMMQGGWILDTSIANIAFRRDDRWYTPSLPLLAGTTWKRLISERKIIPRPIHHKELNEFEAFKIFNAMNDWEEILEVDCAGCFF